MWYLAALIVLEIALFATNFKTGTFLVGWDSVMPEFNLSLNLSRSLFSLWQEYRGLGLLDGMAHSANIVHTLFIWLTSLLLPESALRYLYIHTTHLLGGIGFFFLARKLIKNKPASFIGAVFYMLNIGVIQMYYAPLEVFATHFAALPIVTLAILNALENTTRRNLFALFAATLLLSQQAFVPTVFMAFSVLLIFIFFFYFLHTKFDHNQTQKTSSLLKHIAIVALTFFLANAYWLLPYSYSALKTPSTIASTRINQFSSEEVFYRNKAHGDFTSVATLQGFMLDTIEYDQQNNSYFSFMGTWAHHFRSIPSQIIAWIIFAASLAGIVLALLKREWKLFPFAAASGVAFFFLANSTPVFEQGNSLLRTLFPLVGEAFRFPFTKFITLFSFCLALFFAYFLSNLSLKKKYIVPGMYATTLASILFLAYPVFRGFFTSPALRLQIPDYYTKTFEYFETQPKDSRIVLLPAETFWNWGYTSWGFRGSGFIWHGLPQSLVMRAFDPWSLTNEQAYNELSQALVTEDGALLESVIQKYDFHYLLIDTSVINPLSRQPINYDKLESFLAQSNVASRVATFDKIHVYKTTASTGYVYSLDQNATVTAYPPYTSGRIDTISSTIGNYAQTATNPDILTLFPTLVNEKLPENSEIEITESQDSFTITPKNFKPVTVKNAKLAIPALTQYEFLIPVQVSTESGRVILTLSYPEITINDTPVQIPTREITLETSIRNISQVTFPDIGHAVSIGEKPAYSYILNTNAVMIIVSNGTQEERFVLDTTQESSEPLLIDLPNETINSYAVTVPKILSPLAFPDTIEKGEYEIKENTNSTGTISRLTEPESLNLKTTRGVTLSARNTATELAFYRDNLYHQGSYIISIGANYESGLPPTFYIDNTFRDRAIFETRLSKTQTTNHFILPPTEQYFQGYGFHVIVKSMGEELAESTISHVSLYPLLADTLQRIRIVNTQSPVLTAQNADKTTIPYSKANTMHYTVPSPRADTYLVLSQQFDTGWHAYRVPSDSLLSSLFPMFGGDDLSHIQINNWENGWKVDTAGRIVLVYLPLYLQYVGLLMTGVSGIVLLSFTVLPRKTHTS